MKDQYEFKVEPDAETSPNGETLLQALHRTGVELRSDCGGEGICGKCQVLARPAESLSPPSPAELDLLDRGELERGKRLACQAQLLGPVEISLPEAAQDNKTALGKTGIRGSFPVKPTILRTPAPAVAGPGEGEDQPRDLLGWLLDRAGLAGLEASPQALAQVARLTRPEKEMTLLHDGERLLSVLPGGGGRGLGLAIDLGTTTMAAYLCDLGGGQVLASAGMANPQRRFGEDVISRIARASQGEEQTRELHQLVIKGLNDLIARLSQKAKMPPEEIDILCLVGNTTMQELFLGLSPRSLGLFPYLPVTSRAVEVPAGSLGLALNPGSAVRVFPVAAGFIGGDAVAAALAQPWPEPGESVLIVDLGTNGELLLLTHQGAWAASAATGPAFEGAAISCGVRAVPGAVQEMAWDQAQGRPSCGLIPGAGEVKAIGLCGSGLIDAVAVLLEQGVILPSGSLNASSPLVEADEAGVGRRVRLLPAEQCASEEALCLTLKDVRQVQLAKAAIATGISYLLEASGVARVTRTVLTGAFGARFNWQSAVTLGLLPAREVLGRVESIENAAGLGAIMALLDGDQQKRAAELAAAIGVIELNQMPDFNDRFIAKTQFER